MKKTAILIIAFVLCFALNSAVFAAVVLDEGFTDTAQIDMSKTTAKIDTNNRFALLPLQSLTGAVDMLQEGMGFATASKAGVNLYEYDDATGQMTLNSVYSCPWATEATGVSIRQDNLNMWSITGDSISYYKFNGAGMSDDPALKITGLSNIISVSAIKNTDWALLLQGDGNNAKITRYEAGAGLNPALIFQPGITDPVKVTMVNDSPDFRLFTKNAAYYFMYDDGGGIYVEDPARKIDNLTEVVSGGSDDTGNLVLSRSSMDYYMNSDTGGATRVDVFSPGPVTNPVAVALKQGFYEQIFLDENGRVQWWTYDDFANGMVRETSLEIPSLILNSGYAHPRNYISKAVATAPYDAAKLTVLEDKPSGTSIGYAVSSDGGNTFTGVVPGIWTKVPRGSSFVVRGILDTWDSQQTPKILRVTLDVEEDLVLEGFVEPQPAERGGNVTVSARAVSLTTGEEQVLDSCLVRIPLEIKPNGDPALPEGEPPTNAAMIFNPGTGFWEFTFTIPEKTVDDRWPDDGVYQAQIIGVKGAATKMIKLHLEINGHILERLIIRTMSW